MLYPDKEAPVLDEELFRHPTAPYRGAPFWAWNCRLDKEELRRQIGCFREMGFGGFHIHSRTGMATPYLQPEFFDLVRFCAEEAEKQGLRVWLYDEDRWPSGAAGGLVTRHKPFRERRLRLSPENRTDDRPMEQALEEGVPYYLASYRVRLTPEGTLAGYQRVSRAEKGADIRHAFVLPGEESPWFNNQAYLDTLSPAAVDAFIHTTHDRYAAAVGEFFGGTIPAVFTDEPRPAFRRRLAFAAGKEGVETAWTPDFPATFEAAYGYSLPERLPEIFWDLPDGRVSQVRWQYHDHVTQRFVSAFPARCAAWCRDHGLLLTGHMLQEDTLFDQTCAVGEAMRCYRAFPLPGIDILCDAVHLVTAKQAQSAARQEGREGVLSELYGVTHWDFDFRGHKFQGDWQAALGITQRVPHLSWTSMEGEAKRDYPASIHYQSPWYKEYGYIEDHFARLNTVLTRGKPVVNIGVIHPIESYWLHWGPGDTGGARRQVLEERFRDLTHWLLQGLVDFDFISEASLPDLGGVEDGALRVGQMRYELVLVPGCETLRTATLERLEAFRQAGGRLLFLGEPPRLENALPSSRGERLARSAAVLPFERSVLLTALADRRFCTLREENGEECRRYVGQLRQDGGVRWLFLAPCVKPPCPDVAPAARLRLTLRGRWKAVRYDTLTGSTQSLPGKRQGTEGEEGSTLLEPVLYPQDSLLLRLEPAEEAGEDQAPPSSQPLRRIIRRAERACFTREEPNVLLLDRFQGLLDGKPVGPAEGEEVLRLDNRIRDMLGLPPRTNKFAQPWVTPAESPKHKVTIVTNIYTDCPQERVSLGLERAEEACIRLNGEPVPMKACGWYVDRAISTVPLPPLRAGENRLEVTWPYGPRSGLESLYILGDFDVELSGTRAVIRPPRRELGFGSITGQGMPFYGGNLTYRLPVDMPFAGGRLKVRVPAYRGALVKAALDGKPLGRIVFAPYEASAEEVAAGPHTLELTLYSNRFNTFGSLHNINTADRWYGFTHWRSTGDAWCEEYRLKETGILAGPEILLEERHAAVNEK